jgi:hypothetical protein
MKVGFASAKFVCLTLAVATGIAFHLNSAAAQSPDQGPVLDRWDMWNPNWMQRDMWAPGQMGPGVRQRVIRHWTFIHQGTPAENRNARNPFAPDAETISEGRAL